VLDTERLLRILSDKGTCEILNFVANNTDVRRQTLRDKFGFSIKQYYSRIQRLMEYGLVNRKSGVFTLSSFGIVVYQDKLRIDAAIREYNNLKAIDAIKATNKLAPDIREKVISNIVTDDDVKMTLLNFAVDS
jgi:predicted transcriptional regulator